MKKQILAVVLAMCMVFCMVPISVLAVGNVPNTKWTDYASTSFAGGVGSETDPYQIATAEQLAKLSKDVSDEESYKGKFFKITENIDLSAHRWVPIGLFRWEDDDTEYGNTTNNEPFRGFIDGNNKTLTGLYVDESTTQYSAGFIGNIVNTSESKVGVKDLSIVNAEIIADDRGLMELNAGILVGTTMANEGYTISFENITVSGNISVTMSSGSHKVGGIIGSANRLTVKNCKAESIGITGATNAGGIVGCDGGSTFENCTTSGKISGGWSLGGFVGYSTTVNSSSSGQSTYTKCAANVEITGDDWRLGGFVGSAEYGKFDKCVSTGKVTSTVTTLDTKIGGFMGESDYAVADKCHTVSKVVSASTDYNPGGFVGNVNNGTFTDCSFDNESNDNMDAIGTGTSLSGIEGYNTNIVLANICKDYYDGHKYATDWTIDAEATCSTDGSKSKHCERCDVKDDITKISATDHNVGTEWMSDGTDHWNECTTCKEKLNKSAHTYKWVTDKEATATQAGSRHEECTVCGYAKVAETIPTIGATPDNNTDNKSNTISPQTGDNSNILIWFALLFVSGEVFISTVGKINRKEK